MSEVTTEEGLVLLTLVVSRSVEDTVLDLLLAHPDIVPGFTTHPAEGHGARVALHEPREQVMGSARRLAIRIVSSRETANGVIALLKESLSGAKVFYWVVPVLEAGRIG